MSKKNKKNKGFGKSKETRYKPQRVIFAWPTFDKGKGYPTYAQNRQVQFFKHPFLAYPMVAAQAATMIHRANNEILWLDAVAEELSDFEFADILAKNPTDYLVFEASTPLSSRYIEIINGIKEQMPKVKIVLTGEYVTALPEEAQKKCHADYFIRGGKWHKDLFALIMGRRWAPNMDIPFIDRDLTRWWLYGYDNGNFKDTPGTYIQSASDCWHRPGCTFCSWDDYHSVCETRSVDSVIDEVHSLINKGFKEIFDDSGTFPTGEWLEAFCKASIERGWPKHVKFGCNMRFGALKPEHFQLLKKAGFRFILWGMESANQKTLDLLNKNVDIKRINQDLILAKAAKLESHVSVMFGFPWETYKGGKCTADMVKHYLEKGFIESAQASLCIPYPGTELWKTCKETGALLSENWDDYDMSKPIMKSQCTDKQLKELQESIYKIIYNPKFALRKLLQCRSLKDVAYLIKAGKKAIGRF